MAYAVHSIHSQGRLRPASMEFMHIDTTTPAVRIVVEDCEYNPSEIFHNNLSIKYLFLKLDITFLIIPK